MIDVAEQRPVSCRAVITGMGLVCHLGSDVQTATDSLIKGETRYSLLDDPDYSRSKCRLAGVVDFDDVNGQSIFSDLMSRSERRQLPRFIQMGVSASEQALKQAEWFPTDREDRLRTGVVLGTGCAGMSEVYWGVKRQVHPERARTFSPYTNISSAPNTLPTLVAIRNHFLGYSIANSDACATGLISIAHAVDRIRKGDANIVLAGASEAPINPVMITSFYRIGALSIGCENHPESAVRPFDETRAGFVISEGSAVVVVERLDHALARGAEVLAEICGLGIASDSFHVTQPEPSGDGQQRAMSLALKESGLLPDSIEYVNTHATSTPLGDPMEIASIDGVLGRDVSTTIPMSSFKGNLGHSLASCGVIELVLAIASLRRGVIPPTLNLRHPDPSIVGHHLISEAIQNTKLKIFMKNSFGFGGINASIVMRLLD